MLRSVLLLVGSLAFVAIGIFLLLKGQPQDAPLSFGIIAFFGACAIVGALQLAPRQRAELDASGGLTLRPDRLQMIGFVIGALGMAAGCYLLAPLAAADGKQIVSTVAYVGVAFFGLGGLALIWRVANPKDIGRIDAEGAQIFGPGGWSVSWRDVEAISTFSIHGQNFIKLETGARPSATSLGDFTLSAAGTRLAFEQLHALTLELWKRNARN